MTTQIGVAGCLNPVAPAQIHKEGTYLRPIVSTCDSPTNELAKLEYLSNIYLLKAYACKKNYQSSLTNFQESLGVMNDTKPLSVGKISNPSRYKQSLGRAEVVVSFHREFKRYGI